jgi:hypothetical protein
MTRKARSGARSALTPSATMRSASMSRPESVSSRMQKFRLEQRHLQDLHALLLAAGEADIERALEHFLGDFELRRRLVDALDEVGVVSSTSPRALRCAFSAALRKVIVATPGISSGYWKARKMPGGALGRVHLQDVLAVEQDLAVE